MNAEQFIDRYGINPNWGREESMRFVYEALKAAFEEGQREMRERAAKAIDHLYEDAMYTSVLTYGATKIRALPLTPRGGESGLSDEAKADIKKFWKGDQRGGENTNA